MHCFDNFDPLTGEVPFFPFSEIWGVASEARIYLAGLSGDDIRAIEKYLDVFIYDTQLDFARINLDRYVKRVISECSWELNYLPVGVAATQQSVRHLLENWPEPESSDEIYYETEDDCSDLTALRIGIMSGSLGALENEHSYPIQCVSVLALMKVAECLDTLKCPEEDLGTSEDGPIAARLICAANFAIEAALAIGYADALAELAESRAESNENITEEIEGAQRRFSEDRARLAVAKKLAKDPKQKDKVLVRARWNEWQTRPNQYKSKAAFSLDILKSFKNLENQAVIEGWCRTWERES